MRRRAFVTRTGRYTALGLLLCGFGAAAAEPVAVYARAPGKIAALMVKVGDRVSAGQIVATLDEALLLEAVKTAEEQLNRAKADHEATTRTLERAKDLYDRQTIPRRELDAAYANTDRAARAQAEALARLQQARHQVPLAMVKSPAVGTVTRLLKQVGDTVDGTAATALLELTAPAGAGSKKTRGVK
ncbi:MAG: biotin/lipoyl-binding protein [Myxococcaceae bacterium]